MDPLYGVVFRVAFAYALLTLFNNFSGKRLIGDISPFDFAIVIMAGDMLDDMIWQEVPLLQGVVGLSSILLLHSCLSVLTYLSPRLNMFFGSGNVRLIKDGRLDLRGQRRERLDKGNVEMLLRLQGEEEMSDVREANLESNGQLSVLYKPAAKPLQKRDLEKIS